MKTKTIIVAMFAALLPFSAWGGQTGIQQVTLDDVHVYNYGNTNDGNADDEDDGPIVERTLNLKDFKAIRNNFSAEVQYTPNSQYSVKVAGSPKALDATEFSVKDGTLYIDVSQKFKGRTTNLHKGVILYVSSPNLESISNTCALTIKADQWKLKELNVENSSALTFKVNNLDCQSLDISNSGAFSYKEGSVKADNVSISNSGSCKIDLTFSVKNAFDLSNSGACKLGGNVTAKSFSESCIGAIKDEAHIMAESLVLDINGAGNVNSTFKGKTASITGNGASKINITVDCEKLAIDSNGLSRITVRGTADDAKIENNGIVKVDASELNKF